MSQASRHTEAQRLELQAVKAEIERLTAELEAIYSLEPSKPESLTDLIAEHLSGTYHCHRVWSAWQVGTMSEDDFSDVGDSETPGEIAAAILKLVVLPERTK